MATSMSLAETSPVRVTPLAARALQGGWLIVLLGTLTLAVAATPSLHAIYRTTCPEQLCDLLPQPNADSVRLLERLGVPSRDYASAMVAVEWLYLLLAVAVAGVIIWKQPRDPVGLPLAYVLAVIGGASFLRALRHDHPDFALPAQISTFVVFAAAVPLFARFPDGRWVPRWSRWLALAAPVVGAAFAFTAGGPLEELELPANLALWAFLLGTQVYRYRRVSDTIGRQQTKWLLFGMGMFVLNIVIVLGAFLIGLAARYQFVILPLCYASSGAMILAIGFAILRYRLFDIDVVLNRTLVYGGLTAGVLAIYTLIVGGLGSLLRVQGELGISLLATGVVAVVFQPLRDRLQRGVNRLLYGERDQPYEVIARLGRRLEASLSPDTVLPTIVETVATALKLPYAAVVLGRPETETVAAEYGARGVSPLVAVPLTYQGEPVGELRFAPRTGERTLAAADRRLLDDLARQAGVAAHAVAVTRDLRRAREQLITGREEERRRLRRDLHDGLGPALASMALQADAARDLYAADPARADALLTDLTAQLQAATADIRRLVYALRPPALDEIGLVGALRAEAARHELGRTRIDVLAPEALPPLPAAVEVAAYRIAQEAVTNVLRHADARACSVALTYDHVAAILTLDIIDDGRGLPPDPRAGVGLTSMRERTEELGGSVAVEPLPGGGTRVRATLPCPPPAAEVAR